MFVIIRDFYGNDIFMASSMYSQIPAVGCKNICIHLVPSPMTSLWAFPVQIPTLSIIGKLSWDWGWKLSVSHQFSLIPSNLNILWWKCDYESPLSECVCFNFSFHWQIFNHFVLSELIENSMFWCFYWTWKLTALNGMEKIIDFYMSWVGRATSKHGR